MNATTKRILSFSAPPIIVIGLMLSSVYLWPGLGMPEAIIVGVLAIVAAFVIRDGFFLRDDYLARWTKSHGIVITDENRDVLLRYLRRGRRIRAAGGLIGYATYVIWLGVIGDDNVGVGWLRATFGGYLLGAAVAELWAFRPEPGAPRAAALIPRRVTTYVPRYAIVLARVVPLAIVTLVAGWHFIPKGRSPFPELPFRAVRPDFAEALAWVGVSIVLVVLVEATARRIVRRPQPAVSEALIEADDAIRSTAMHGLVGAGVALQLGVLSRLAGRWTEYTSGNGWHAWLGTIAFLAGLLSILSWMRLGIDQEWVVRRTQRRQEAAA